MGSVMDQERPWERAEKPLNTLRQRIAYAAQFGRGSEIDRIIDELETLEERLTHVEAMVTKHLGDDR